MSVIVVKPKPETKKGKSVTKASKPSTGWLVHVGVVSSMMSEVT